MKLRLLYIIVTCCLTSCSNVNKNIHGNWGILEIYHGQNEISNNSGNTYLTPKLFVINRSNKFDIDFNGKRQNEYGHFHFAARDTIELSDMPTEFLNGKYAVKIKQTKGTEKSKSKTFELTLENDSVYIRAIKYVTKI